MILTREGVLGIGESYELYQGYSVTVVEPASSGSKAIIRITLDGQTIDEESFISKGMVYNFTRKYDEKDFTVLAITLLNIDSDNKFATLRIIQYIDPSRPATEFLITDRDEKLEPGTHLILEQDYSLNIEEFGNDSATLGLYKNNVMVTERTMKENDAFNYRVTSNGKDQTIISFNIKGIFKGSTRNAVFIEHLYQFEEPIVAKSVKTITSAGIDSNNTNGNNTNGNNTNGNNSNTGSSNISVSVQVTNNEGENRIYKNESINVTYYLGGSGPFDTARVTIDGNIIEEVTAPQPGMHSIIRGPLPVGGHIVEVSALSGDSGRISDETKIYVRKNFAENLVTPKVNLTPALFVFVATTLFLILWAAVRRHTHDPGKTINQHL
ncbi:MAG: hypothetical protein M8353_00705 [ANME-2 cluster archaeon]|nr:hypothetical protein [ANME-2 cluster archaeon]